MLNAAQIHLALNHLPLVGILIGMLVLVAGLWLKQSQIKNTGLLILVISALCAVPTYLSGEPTEKIVEQKPGVTKALIHEHEEAAEFGLIFSLLTGAMAGAALVLPRCKREGLGAKATIAAVVLSLFTLTVLARVAHLGGLIRHDELRTQSGG